MPPASTTTNLSAAKLRAYLRRIPEIASSSAGPIARAVLINVGLAALEQIHRAFIVKSQGGTDETGLRWAPLAPSTIAARLNPKRKSRSRGNLRPSSALSSKHRQLWWSHYSRYLGAFRGNKAAAARAAWTVLKGMGVPTLRSLYANRQVDILNDTGALQNSLHPGDLVSASSTPRTAIPKVRLQVFRVEKGAVTIGTTRPHAMAHHEGVPQRRLPQRRLWPETSKWTTGWWDAIMVGARNAITSLVVQKTAGRGKP